MEYVPIIDKNSFVIASLYDIMHVPSSPYTILPYTFYVSSFGKPLYIAYFIEKHNLWKELFLRLINASHKSSEELDYVIKLLESIELPMWEELSSILYNLHPLIYKVFNEKKNDIIDKIKHIFGFNKFFRKIYVIYGFNPLPKYTYGSMLYWDRENTMISVYINDMQSPEKAVDIIIHEMLHGLMRLNNIELRADIEELLIDISCPEGYLSKLLGLVDKVNVNEVAEKYEDLAELATMVITYYENKVYEDNVNLIQWITNYMSDRRLPII